jgi:UDP-N-acetylmuramate dehydrogenase
MINIRKNHPLREYNTFGLDSTAGILIESDETDALMMALAGTGTDTGNLLILGGGSNLLFLSPLIPAVIRPVNEAISLLEESSGSVLISAGAGSDWDRFVAWCVSKGYGGLENLSLIPGTVGAAPVQNIGAYGAEIGVNVAYVRVLDLLTGKLFSVSGGDCRFGYRHSIFKEPDHQAWLVWEVVFQLEKDPLINLEYQPLKECFAGGIRPGIAEVRDAVIRIRKSKLPDPAETGNAGSFFKNPVVSACQAGLMRESHEGMPAFYHGPGTVKIPAGWLIEQCGWKGFREGDAGIWPLQALVLVNHGSAEASDIIRLADRITESVKNKFGIKLEREVRVV